MSRSSSFSSSASLASVGSCCEISTEGDDVLKEKVVRDLDIKLRDTDYGGGENDSSCLVLNVVLIM